MSTYEIILDEIPVVVTDVGFRLDFSQDDANGLVDFIVEVTVIADGYDEDWQLTKIYSKRLDGNRRQIDNPFAEKLMKHFEKHYVKDIEDALYAQMGRKLKVSHEV